MKKANGHFNSNFVSKLSLILGAYLLFVSAPAFAQKQYKAFVRVDGASCYSCSYGIEKRCKKKHVGSHYKLDLEKGIFEIRFSPTDQIPTPEEFRDIIHDAGYSFGGVTIIVDGQLLPTAAKNRFQVQVSESHQLVPVQGQRSPALHLTKDRKARALQLQLHADMKNLDWRLVTVLPQVNYKA